MNLYWVTTEDHAEDWFITANNAEEAAPIITKLARIGKAVVPILPIFSFSIPPPKHFSRKIALQNKSYYSIAILHCN